MQNTNKVLTPTTSKDTNANNDLLPEDDVPTKEDGFIDCLQNMTNINKVSQKNNSTQILFSKKYKLIYFKYSILFFLLFKTSLLFFPSIIKINLQKSISHQSLRYC